MASSSSTTTDMICPDLKKNKICRLGPTCEYRHPTKYMDKTLYMDQLSHNLANLNVKVDALASSLATQNKAIIKVLETLSKGSKQSTSK